MELPENDHLPEKATKMNYGIAIPKPCHEDWNSMTPDSQGRHCAQCCKTVIDFTEWSTDDIAAYLYAQRHQSVCGRFKEDQLDTITIEPETYILELHKTNFSFMKKIAAVFLFVFCLSANADAQHKQQPVTGTPKEVMMGKPARVEQGEVAPVKQQPVKQNDGKVVPGKRPVPMIMGGIAMPVKRPQHDTGNHVKGRIATPVRK